MLVGKESGYKMQKSVLKFVTFSSIEQCSFGMSKKMRLLDKIRIKFI